MRISTSMQYQNHLSYLQTANTRVDSASKRYNTGKLFQTAGEDPSGMAASIKYTSDIAAYEQYSKNAGIVADTLSQEETALGQIWDSLSGIRTRLIQAINGTLDDGSRAALAEDIKQTQAQLFDLMNTKDGDGGYIFSGADNSEPTYTLTTDGQYKCQADGSSKYVLVSPTIKVQTTDSGLNIFENCHLPNDFTSGTAQFTNDNTAAPPVYVANGGFTATIDDYDQFSTFYNGHYDYADATKNKFTISVKGSEFDLLGPDGTTVIEHGNIKDGKITVQGMEFTVPNNYNQNDPNASGEIPVTLDPPEQDNILNQLTTIINDLLVPSENYGDGGGLDSNGNPMSKAQLTRNISRMEEAVSIAMKRVDQYRGYVGARGANIDSILESDKNLGLIKSEAKAKVTEIDAFQAVSDLVLSQNALSVAQQTYNLVHSSTLFDYIS